MTYSLERMSLGRQHNIGALNVNVISNNLVKAIVINAI